MMDRKISETDGNHWIWVTGESEAGGLESQILSLRAALARLKAENSALQSRVRVLEDSCRNLRGRLGEDAE